MKKIYSITLSLAGICQSAYLVQKLAYSGKCDNHAFVTCLKSILEINPTSLMKIYGNDEKNLNIGLEILISLLTLSNFSYSYIELIKYILNMIIIENKLKKNSNTLYSLKQKLLIISNKYHTDKNINILTYQLAELYLKNISSLGSRILVKGTKNFLENIAIQEKIRCLLFSGIRSVVLWKQFEGNEFKIIFFRKCIIKKAKIILYNLKNNI
ncbi:Ycfc [Buchnera aphidicola str. G002 (Myzus persicae)]|uniref:High frequency lysogenization protein HflD homolog n=1 Tax=Buchnera aphidicola str. USDA (Myzus persicae) TaxID=1009856 RepID=W0P4X6_BUCMP|nr:Ycfc [Buchnera aphidicola str. USDA (Myzus persicae)]AHG60698.1 Ycfc [Buchnera aphidicola str. W106 (Myzus persicae)]AHG61270.1 Ycfc [Buchnera aphidicola str. G002 (Myzus persicae)]AHG61843.1 Ycfc [Buchnera aphidicola str. F009 (Myzus persicae)]